MHYNYEVGQEIKSFNGHDIPAGLIMSDRYGSLWLNTVKGWKYVTDLLEKRRRCMTIEYVPEGHNKVVQPEVGDFITKQQLKNLPDESIVRFHNINYPTNNEVYYKTGNLVNIASKKSCISISIDHLYIYATDKLQLLYIGEES